MGTQSSVGHHRENSHGNRIDSKMQYYKISLSFACVALCGSQNQAQDVQPKDVCEADINDCKSSETSFKCMMAFKNLTDLPIKVLDIIPDLIGQNPEPEIKAELQKKEITFEAFEIEDACPQPGASAGERLKQINKATNRSNARCYAFLSDYAKSNLESCDTGLISSKESKAQTVGYVLCERAYSLYNYESPPKFWFTALDQKLCCVRKGTTVKYRPCNGSKRTVKEC